MVLGRLVDLQAQVGDDAGLGLVDPRGADVVGAAGAEPSMPHIRRARARSAGRPR